MEPDTPTVLRSVLHVLSAPATPLPNTKETPVVENPKFDPFSRPTLLRRLRTYNALNWSVPFECSLNELQCASFGWICVSQNTIKCTECGAQLLIRFDDSDDVNRLLVEKYVELVQKSAHRQCPWAGFSVSIYYLRPHIAESNATLLNEYLSNLWQLSRSKTSFPCDFKVSEEFKRVSSLWLAKRYSSNKENLIFPDSVYALAAMGWQVRKQRHCKSTVSFIVCMRCNLKIILPGDPDHKPWCCLITDMDKRPFFEYFVDMVTALEKCIGPDGEYIDSHLEVERKTGEKRTIDVKEGLERLSKLRKLYFE